MSKINNRQRLFIKEYLIDLNATEAAKRAGYSEKTARSQGQRLLTNVDIFSEIQKQIDQRSQTVKIKSEDILKELLILATVDISEAFDGQGKLKNLHEIPESVRRAISSIEIVEEFGGTGKNKVQTGWNKKIKFWDKPKSLELLGKHLKLFTDKLEVSGKVELAERIKKARARVGTK